MQINRGNIHKNIHTVHKDTYKQAYCTIVHINELGKFRYIRNKYILTKTSVYQLFFLEIHSYATVVVWYIYVNLRAIFWSLF